MTISRVYCFQSLFMASWIWDVNIAPPPTSPLLLVVLLLFDQLFDILVLLIHIKFLSYQLQGMV